MAAETLGRHAELASPLTRSSSAPRTGRSLSCSRARRGSGSRRSGSPASRLRATRGFLVLSSRPCGGGARARARRAGRPLKAVLDDVLPALTAPRRRALEAALLVEPGARRAGRSTRSRSGGPDPRSRWAWRNAGRSWSGVDERAVARAARRANALAFSVRRLRSERVASARARAATRRGSRRDADSRKRVGRGAPVERRSVGPAQRGGAAAAPETADRRGCFRAACWSALLEGISGGNPFYALELARGLAAEGALAEPAEPFPGPGVARAAR